MMLFWVIKWYCMPARVPLGLPLGDMDREGKLSSNVRVFAWGVPI